MLLFPCSLKPWEELILVSKTLLLFKRRALNDVFLRKISPASLSIMPGREHNFGHDAKILGVTLKSITLKFSSILYQTLSSKLSVNSWFTIPYVDVCAYFIPDSADIPILFFYGEIYFTMFWCVLYIGNTISMWLETLFLTHNLEH